MKLLVGFVEVVPNQTSICETWIISVCSERELVKVTRTLYIQYRSPVPVECVTPEFARSSP